MRVGASVRNPTGKTLFVIHLRDNAVRAVTKQAAYLSAPRPAEAKENQFEKRGWHRKEVRHLVSSLEKQYGFEAESLTSWVAATAKTYLTPELAQAIAYDPRVLEVEEVDATVRLNFSSVWNDRYDGAELVTWGKQSIGTDDLLTTSNPIYMIDRTPFPHTDLTVNTAPVNNPGVWNDRAHGTFIAGILAGKMNGQFSRGINPGASNLWSVEIGSTSLGELRDSVDWILAHNEQNGTYGTVNFSLNYENTFRFDQPYGKLIRRLSTRAFVAQSAGNQKLNACEYAYCSPQFHGYYGERTKNLVDGIVVVGGVNADNQQDFPYDNNNIPFLNFNPKPFFEFFEAGSNAGHCVDMWAPSTAESTVSYYLPNNPSIISGTIKAKGTSFAAPHIAALAARYGGPTTTPVQREAFLRSKLQHVGYLDSLSENIFKPNWLATPLFAVPARLTPTFISASSSTSNSDLWSTQDGLYLSGNFWNAGSANGWIQFDLGQVRTLSSLRLISEQSGYGTGNHQIWLSDGVNGFYRFQTVSEYVETLSPISMSLNNAVARFVRIQSNLLGLSWVSWREVEIYGY